MQTIAIASDHAGYHYKEKLIDVLRKMDFEVVDHGPPSDTSVDYPDHVHPLAKTIDDHSMPLGILICGSGNGVCMTANKYANVRAALCWNTELAQLARQHNNANILCIPARFVSQRMANSMVKAFVSTKFEGGRHARRVNKISCS